MHANRLRWRRRKKKRYLVQCTTMVIQSQGRSVLNSEIWCGPIDGPFRFRYIYVMGRRWFMRESKSSLLVVSVRTSRCTLYRTVHICRWTELFYDRGHHHEFLSLSQELAAPGEMRQAQTYQFNFKNVEKQYESYQGINVKLRCVRSTSRADLWGLTTYPDILSEYWYRDEWQMLIKKKISGYIHSGCLQIAIIRSRWKSELRIVCISSSSITSPSAHLYVSTELQSTDKCSRYHLKDVIVGKIYFLLVRIKIKHMELSIIRRETTGAPPNQYNESETITKFEIMDGAPVRG